MPWEIADRAHPERAGARYASLERGADECARAEPAGRFYLRWIGEGAMREPIIPIMGWQSCRLVWVATDEELGDIYECTTHPGYTVIGCQMSCEGADIAGGDA